MAKIKISKVFYKIFRICNFLNIISLVFLSNLVFAEAIDPQKLLEEVDNNLWSNTKYIEGRLIINNGRLERTLEMLSWMEGVERSYSFYKAPPREKGTKMLKIASKLWMFTPRTDRKILIAGHMLRQSMMGSDLSYEDLMEDKKLSRIYKAKLSKLDYIRGVSCFILILKANDKATTYQNRKLWVGPERQVILREELYAKSGMLIKDIEFLGYRAVGKRLFQNKWFFVIFQKKIVRQHIFLMLLNSI